MTIKKDTYYFSLGIHLIAMKTRYIHIRCEIWILFPISFEICLSFQSHA